MARNTYGNLISTPSPFVSLVDDGTSLSDTLDTTQYQNYFSADPRKNRILHNWNQVGRTTTTTTTTTTFITTATRELISWHKNGNKRLVNTSILWRPTAVWMVVLCHDACIQVFVHYCDGASYSGDAIDAMVHRPTGRVLHFSGRRLLDAIFDDLIGNQGESLSNPSYYTHHLVLLCFC